MWFQSGDVDQKVLPALWRAVAFIGRYAEFHIEGIAKYRRRAPARIRPACLRSPTRQKVPLAAHRLDRLRGDRGDRGRSMAYI